VRLIDARVGGEDLKAADVYREMLPAALHVVKEVRLTEPARCQWCSDVRERIAGLMEWLGGGALGVDIRKAILQEMREDGDDPEYLVALMSLGIALSSQGCHTENLDLHEQALAFRRRVLPADHPDIAASFYNIGCSSLYSGAFLQCSFFAHEALAIWRFHFSNTHPHAQKALKLINDVSARHGAAAAQPMPSPPSPHLRIGLLVRLHGLSALALNGSQALMFGPEQNGRVPVRLVEASAEVRALLMKESASAAYNLWARAVRLVDTSLIGSASLIRARRRFLHQSSAHKLAHPEGGELASVGVKRKKCTVF
jgi:hypothetical protein